MPKSNGTAAVVDSATRASAAGLLSANMEDLSNDVDSLLMLVDWVNGARDALDSVRDVIENPLPGETPFPRMQLPEWSPQATQGLFMINERVRSSLTEMVATTKELAS